MTAANRAGRAGLRKSVWLPIVSSTLVVAVFLCVIVLQPGGELPSLVVGSLIVTLSALVAGMSCLRAGRQSIGVDRFGWFLMAAGMWSWTLGNIWWLWYMVSTPTGPPVPSPADALFFGLVPFALASAAALGGLDRGGFRVLLDGLIISGSLLALSFATVLGAVIRAKHDGLLLNLVMLGLPIGDIAMAAMTFILLSRADRRRRSTLALVCGGMLALAVAESGMAYMIQAEVYSTGFLANVGYIVGFLLIGHGARHSRHGAAPRVAADSPLWLLLPYVPLTLALTTLVLMRVVTGDSDAMDLTLGAVLVVLVIARQWLVLRDNVHLTRNLRVTLDQLRRREEELEHLAFHDSLTGLANRALFHDLSERAIKQSAAYPPSVLYIDLDGFKQVNDRLGHAAGDALLVAVADRLRACVPASDTVARLGGDEFAVLCDSIDSADGLNAVGERIVYVLGEEFRIEGETVRIGASVGGARGEPDRYGNVHDLLRRADIAMYAAKMQGKRRHLMFDPAMLSAVAVRAA
jgi:diguanylate cyclase (GGDEF)-like protein